WRRRVELAPIMRLGGVEHLGMPRLFGLAASRFGLLAWTARLFGNGHSDRAGKRAHGLGETGARVLHQESDGAAMSSATEAVVKLLGGATVNDGLFSLWKGQRPSRLAPPFLSCTYRPTTSTTSTRARRSWMNDSGINRFWNQTDQYRRGGSCWLRIRL